MNKAYYVACTNCDTWIESIPLTDGRRLFSTFEKAMSWLEKNVLQWYKPDEMTVAADRPAWVVPTASGHKCIWEIETVTIQ